MTVRTKKNTPMHLWDVQNLALRDPQEIINESFPRLGIQRESLRYTVSGSFLAQLEKLGITLIVTREYEHLVIGLSVQHGRLRQSYLCLPHPTGVTVDRKTSTVYIASTRNPNKIVELKPASGYLQRLGATKVPLNRYLLPSREKFLAGAYYLHDLAMIGRKLYANSVGHNGIAKIDFSKSSSDPVLWSPLSTKGKGSANWLQLNSIAAGKSLATSFFSASAEKPGRYRPGDTRFPVEQQGVIFSGRTRQVYARGLTRPHSAKMYRGKIWVQNSGFGEFGYIEKGAFVTFLKFPGWTRGLCFVKNIAFVGVSRVLPRFAVYAPGITSKRQPCAIYAVHMDTGKILGSLSWDFGNQIFGIDWLPVSVSEGFPFVRVAASGDAEKNIFFRYLL